MKFYNKTRIVLKQKRKMKRAVTLYFTRTAYFRLGTFNTKFYAVKFYAPFFDDNR